MYENQTYDVILQRMLDRVSSKFDKREGAVIFDTHSPTALEFEILYVYLESLINDAYGDTASRDFLILRCKERGITPYPATHAILKGEFTPETVDVTGQRFNLSEINYLVTEKISDGVYKLECETAGNIGNQYLGTMIPIDYIDGLETAELTEVLIPGEDEEDTEALRERYFESFDEKAFGGNVKDYIEKTNAIPGVGSTKVTRVWNGGLRPADLIPSDRVKAWYESIIGTLNEDVAAWLTSVYAAADKKMLTTGGTVLLTIIDSEFNPPSQTLVETVQSTIDPDDTTGEGMGIAPIGHVVKVEGVTPVSVNVKTSVVFETGYSWSNLQASIEAAISDYLLELRKSWANSEYLIVRISQIETRILSVQGVVDIADTTLNGEAKNLTLGKYEVPILGGVGE